MLLLFACFLLILGKLELHKLASSIPSGFPWWFSVQQCSNHYHLGANQYNYVIADLLILASCFGSQSSSSLVTSSFLLQQCPMNHSLLIFIVSVILGWWSHMSLLVLCIFQETPRTALGILLYVPQSSSSIFQHRKSVHFQLWPKRNLLWDAFVGLISTLSSFCCMQACPILIFMSFSLDCIHKPRYLKLSICFNLFPCSVTRSPSGWLYSLYSV